MSRHRGEAPPSYRPRWGRLAVLGVSLATTAVAMLGGLGVLPSSAGDQPDPAVVAVDAVQVADETAVQPSTGGSSEESAGESTPGPSAAEVPPASGSGASSETADPAPLPAESGEGRRIVFSESEQRVWLVGDAGKVRRTYLVSGSLTDNLDPGTYQVYSRSEDAVGIDDSGTMKWFVRFTQGPSGAAIGFHTIPVDEGERVQTKAELGTPQSHGCIRQTTADAKALWAFAPLGTTVVVV
ncbi:L,D-transpeptidase [Nocardioides litoris]|uniref:L,D-transpeptidase n=1 Tax=Nocardioides litoris TaxID=1926648 RepID=UPI00112180CF|nr:L,D-transpeptidase [Nocardioides litoris]